MNELTKFETMGTIESTETHMFFFVEKKSFSREPKVSYHLLKKIH